MDNDAIAKRAKKCAYCQICRGYPQPKPGMKLCKLWPNGCEVLKGIFEFKRIDEPLAPAGATDGSGEAKGSHVLVMIQEDE